MNDRIYKEDAIALLRELSRRYVSHDTRPLLMFVCGGDQQNHPARNMTVDYVKGNSYIQNVFCVTAESLATERFQKLFKQFDLLKIEALIADVCDCILLYCESAGSICELGAFSVLRPVSPILAVGVDRKYRGQTGSFVMDGPIKRIEELSKENPLARVFYLDFNCPIACADLTDYLRGLRTAVKKRRANKTINRKADEINVSSLALELLDIVTLFPPITSEDLVDLYCEIKKFERKNVRIYSPTMRDFLGEKENEVKLTFDMVIAFMLAADIIRECEGGLVPNVELLDYFMFRSDSKYDQKVETARATVLLRKRRLGVKGASNVYNRFN